MPAEPRVFIYVGGGFVWASRTSTSAMPAVSPAPRCASGSPGVAIRGGYRFNEFIAVEGNLDYYGGFDLETQGGDDLSLYVLRVVRVTGRIAITATGLLRCHDRRASDDAPGVRPQRGSDGDRPHGSCAAVGTGPPADRAQACPPPDDGLAFAALDPRFVRAVVFGVAGSGESDTRRSVNSPVNACLPARE
jgi:hypothetical protein